MSVFRGSFEQAGSYSQFLEELLRILGEEMAGPATVIERHAARVKELIERKDHGALARASETMERNASSLGEAITGFEEFRHTRLEQVADVDLQRLQDMARILTHELRAPVTVIQGCASTLMKAVDSMDRRSLSLLADAMQRNAGNLRDLLRSFKDVQALSAGHLSLDLRACDLSGLVGDTVDDLKFLVQPHPVCRDIEAGVVLEVDPVRIRQVLTNLLSNAAKFSAADAPIDVSLATQDGYVEVAVTDRGPGVPRDRRSELFQRFSRLGSSVHGMGLGLYLSRGIMKAHGGDLVHSEPAGGGARFAMRLPPSRR